ncbi:MAG: response regulator [Chloroflexi bacterium]|nr:MAG: response regulator [Chloroflexota bacterium]
MTVVQQRQTSHGAPLVLVVDDGEINRALVEAFLSDLDCRLRSAEDGPSALAAIDRETPDLVLLDVQMPGMDGYEVCRRIKAGPRGRLLPVVMLTALDNSNDRVLALEAGADDFMSKPVDRVELVARVRSALRLKAVYDTLDSAEQVIFSLAAAVEAKDKYTEKHTHRVAETARHVGMKLGLPERALDALYRGGIIHDIGKIGVSDAILTKAGPLSRQEWAEMRLHPLIGERICEPLATAGQFAPIVRHHHERWDGSGYPDGLWSRCWSASFRRSARWVSPERHERPRHFRPEHRSRRLPRARRRDRGPLAAQPRPLERLPGACHRAALAGRSLRPAGDPAAHQLARGEFPHAPRVRRLGLRPAQLPPRPHPALEDMARRRRGSAGRDGGRLPGGDGAVGTDHGASVDRRRPDRRVGGHSDRADRPFLARSAGPAQGPGMAPAIAEPRFRRPGRDPSFRLDPGGRAYHDDKRVDPAGAAARRACHRTAPLRQLCAAGLAAPRVARFRGRRPPRIHGKPPRERRDRRYRSRSP